MKLIGILNITPDSFSDGGRFFGSEELYTKAIVDYSKKLSEAGADIIDIGGDSTRPGSKCVGPQEEWRRIGGVIHEISNFSSVSVDTHHSKVAQESILAGANFINDISAGFDPAMFKVIADSNVSYVMMFSRCQVPHDFSTELQGDVVEQIKNFFEARIELACKSGVREAQIILDPGMGAFLSSQPAHSWELLERFQEIEELGFPLMIAVSRKGFLKNKQEVKISDRDVTSVRVTENLIRKLRSPSQVYLRVHNVEMHRHLSQVVWN